MNFYKNVTTLNPTFYLHLFFGFPKIKKKNCCTKEHP